MVNKKSRKSTNHKYVNSAGVCYCHDNVKRVTWRHCRAIVTQLRTLSLVCHQCSSYCTALQWLPTCSHGNTGCILRPAITHNEYLGRSSLSSGQKCTLAASHAAARWADESRWVWRRDRQTDGRAPDIMLSAMYVASIRTRTRTHAQKKPALTRVQKSTPTPALFFVRASWSWPLNFWPQNK